MMAMISIYKDLIIGQMAMEVIEVSYIEEVGLIV